MPMGDWINGSNVMEELKKWRKISKLSEQEIVQLETTNLQNLLEFATEKIPFYADFKKVKSEDPREWIKHFPVMKKQDYKTHIESLTSQPLKKLIKKESSGSSGIPGIVYMDCKEQALNRAIQILWWEWSGWKLGTPIIQTGMTYKRGILKSIKDVVLRTKYYNAFGLSDDDTIELLELQRNKSGFFIGGYASSIFVMANIAEANNIKNVKFTGAISWGDKMFPHFRKKIKDVFGCEVTDTYACSEGVMVAAQKDLEYYYIMSPHVYLELLDDKGNAVKDGELGYVVVSRLDSRSMPLIRYYTGDLAVKLPRESYPKKRAYNYPILKQVIGRDTDIVYTRSGKYMIVHFFTGIFEYFREFEQFKVIQKDLDSVIIEYIPSKQFVPTALLQVENRIHDYLKEPFKIIWQKVDKILPTASGKPQIIKSYINNKL